MKHQTAQSEMKIGFGRYMERTCESIYKEDPTHFEWVSRMDTPKKAVIEVQEFMKMYEEEWEDECREAKRMELRERERSETGKKPKDS